MVRPVVLGRVPTIGDERSHICYACFTRLLRLLHKPVTVVTPPDCQAREESARQEREGSKKGKAEPKKARDDGEGPANFFEGVGDFLFNLAAPKDDADNRARTKKLEYKPTYPQD